MTKSKPAKEIISEVNQSLESYSFGDQPANLYDPIRYMLSLGGKRLRPVLAILSFQLTNRELGQVIRPALALEVFHNFTLMHDDIMDEAPLRRGKPTIHEKWNNPIAILSGDATLVHAYELLLESPGNDLAYVIHRFNTIALEVCEGQQIDMDFESELDVEVSQYLEMIRLKTAVLIGFSFEFGALMAGLSREEASVYYRIGEDLGLGFQLMDDFLDVYGDAAKFGKQVGGDIISNKKTFLLINALDKAQGDTKKQLVKWINTDDFNPEEKVESVTSIYNEVGIPELTRQKMQQYFDRSMTGLDDLHGDPSAKSELKSFIQAIIDREK